MSAGAVCFLAAFIVALLVIDAVDALAARRAMREAACGR